MEILGFSDTEKELPFFTFTITEYKIESPVKKRTGSWDLSNDYTVSGLISIPIIK